MATTWDQLDTGDDLSWEFQSVKANTKDIPLTPFFRWVGSKSRIVDKVVDAIGTIKGRYVDPTLGAGAVPLRLVRRGLVKPSQLVLSDLNPHLVAGWQMALEDPAQLIARANQFGSFEEAKLFEPQTTLDRAARFLYLQARSFNGLWRENGQGVYNVAQDRSKKGPVVRADAVWACHQHLRGANVLMADMFDQIPTTVAGDLLYVDPPYLTTFSKYAKNTFGLEAHTKLAQQLHEAVERGVRVLTSNAAVPDVRDLYQGWEVVEIEARRSVSCSTEQRGFVMELLLVGTPR